jgi:hypothetical protein
MTSCRSSLPRFAYLKRGARETLLLIPLYLRLPAALDSIRMHHGSGNIVQLVHITLYKEVKLPVKYT